MDIPTEDYLAIEPSLRAVAASKSITNFGDSRLAVASFGVVDENNVVKTAEQLGGGGSSILHQAQKILTNAQTKALPTTAIEIVAAQAGKILIPTLVNLRCAAAVDYTNISGGGYIAIKSGGLSAQWNESQSGVSGILAPGDANDAQNGTALLTQVSPSNANTLGVSGNYDSDIVNKPIRILASNTGNYTGGDDANTLTASVAYMILNATTGVFE